MKKIKRKDETIILYNTNNNEDESVLNIDSIYDEIYIRQIKNTIIRCICIMLYTLNIAIMFLTNLFISYDLKNEESFLLFATFFSATILLIYSFVKKSKIGKIKVKRGNMNLYYISCLLAFLGTFIFFGGLFEEFNVLYLMGIGTIILGFSIASFYLHFHVKNTNKIYIIFPIRVILILISILIPIVICANFNEDAVYRAEAIDDDMLYMEYVLEFAKDQPATIFKNVDNTFFIVRDLRKITDNYELSISDNVSYIKVVYKSKNKIENLEANSKFAVWKEENNNKTELHYYSIKEKKENTFKTLSNSNDKTSYLGLYKDNIYYKDVNYDKEKIEIIEYNIPSQKEKVIKSFDLEKSNIDMYGLKIEKNIMYIFGYDKNKPILLEVDLKENSNKQPEIKLDEKIDGISTISCEKDKCAIYYSKDNKKKIGLINKKGKLEKEIYLLEGKEMVLDNNILLFKDRVYWTNLLENQKMKKSKLKVYGMKVDHIQELRYAFYITVVDNEVNCLKYYKGRENTVELRKLVPLYE